MWTINERKKSVRDVGNYYFDSNDCVLGFANAYNQATVVYLFTHNIRARYKYNRTVDSDIRSIHLILFPERSEISPTVEFQIEETQTVVIQ